MKKVLLTMAAVLASALLLISCGEKEKTPDEQFKAVVKSSVMESTNKFAGGFRDTFKQVNLSSFGSDGKFSIELDEKTSSLIRGIITEVIPGVDLGWLNSVQLTSSSTLKDDKAGVNLGIGVNSVNILTIECIEDLANAKIYLSMPELLKKYFVIDSKDNYSLKETFKLYMAELKLLKTAPSEKVFTGFVEELLTALLADVSGVERSVQTLSAGLSSGKDVSADYTVLKFALTEEWCEKTGANLKKAVLASENLKAILDWALQFGEGLLYEDISSEEIAAEFADSLEELFDDLSYEDNVVVSVYADSKSHLKGSKLVVDRDSIESKFVQKGSSFGYSLAAVERKNELFSLNGFGSYSGGKMTGDFTVYADEENLFSFSTKNFDLEGMQNLKANGSVSFTLTREMQRELKRELRYTLDENALALIDNLTFILNMQQKDRKSAKTELVIGNGDSPYLRLKGDFKVNGGSKLTVPQEAIDIETLDEDKIMETVREIKMDTVAANLKKAKVADEYVEAVSQLNGEAIANIVESYVNPYGSYSYDDYDDYDGYGSYDSSDNGWWEQN
ncbi:hypothetical protein [Treponema sp.]|uniref:hypothetical protein n=1 Tax=Treponema sp. TaxID=166 RepID=UPI003890314B